MMNIVRRLSDGLVQYKTTEPHELTNKYYKSDNIKAIDINNITHEVIENVVLPLDLYLGVHAYNDGVWTILYQTQYDKRTEDLRTTKINELDKNSETKLGLNDKWYIRELRTEKGGKKKSVKQEIIDADMATYELGDTKKAELLLITDYVELINYDISL